MNHFLRIILVLLKQWFKRRAGFLDPVVSHLSVWFTDQDLLYHMTNSRYHSLADVGLIDWITRTRALRIMRARGWTPIAVHKAMTFHRVLRFPERFTLTTQVVAWTERFVVYRSDFARGGEVTTSGLTVFRFVAKDRSLVSVDDLYQALGGDLERPTPSPDVQALIDTLDAQADVRAARRAQADLNEVASDHS